MVRGSLEVCATGSCCLGTINRFFTFDLRALGSSQIGVLTMLVRLGNTVPYTVNLMDNHAFITDEGMHGYDTNPSNQAPDVSTRIQGPDLALAGESRRGRMGRARSSPFAVGLCWIAFGAKIGPRSRPSHPSRRLFKPRGTV